MDYIGTEEGLHYLFHDWIIPLVVHPLASRLDDVMDNVVRAFGMKNFGQHYNRYWEQRKQDHQKQLDAAHARLERYGEPSVKDTEPSPDIKQDRSSAVSMEQLGRFTEQLSDVIGEVVRESKSETGDGIKEDFTRLKKNFEANPDEFLHPETREKSKPEIPIVLELPEETLARIESMQQASQQAARLAASLPREDMALEELQSIRDMQDEAEQAGFTVFGDRKVSPRDLKTQEDFQKQGHQRLLDMKEDKDDALAWGSSSEFAFGVIEARMQALGYSSLGEMQEAEAKMREQEAELKNTMIEERLAILNKRRAGNNLDPVKAEQLPKITDDEFEEWKQKRKT